MRRKAMTNTASRRHFTRNAVKVRPINFKGAPMRGGIRL